VEGDPNSTLSVSGIVEGVADISSFPVTFYSLLGTTLRNILIGILVLVGMAITTMGRSYDPDHVEMKTREAYKSNPEFKEAVDELEKKYDSFQSQRELARHVFDPKLKEHEQQKEQRREKRRTRNRVIIISIMTIAVVAAIIFAWAQAKKEIVETPSNYIPKTIRV
jgi:hypothetical protein